MIPFWCNSGVATGEATSMQTYEMLLYGTGEKLLVVSGGSPEDAMNQYASDVTRTVGEDNVVEK